MSLQEFIDTFIQKGTVDVYLNHMSNYQGTIRKNESGIKLGFSLGNYNESRNKNFIARKSRRCNDVRSIV